jgi:type VI secretion system FHA domain protein
MTLTLSIRSGPASSPAEFVLNGRDGVIGRATSCDWSLPDPTRHVSSRHFEIRFDGQGYLLVDCSTNGTFLASTGERLSGPHRIVDGEAFTVGPFTIAARLVQASAPPAWTGWDSEREQTTTEAPGWGSPPAPANSGWSTAPAAEPASPGWGALPSQSASAGGWQPRTGPSLARAEPHRAAANWDTAPPLPQGGGPATDRGWAPAPAPAAPPVASAWDTAMPAPDPASGWSSAAPDRPPAPTPDDLWGRIAEGNVVDWARGGFGQPVEPRRDPLGLAPATPSAAPLPPTRTTPAAAPAPQTPPMPRADAFLDSLGIDTARLDDDAAARAAMLFRKLVAGLVVMLEARARAKAQLGAEATAFSPDGHNPLKFARTPDEALAMLLDPSQPGFMPPERAVEDAFKDLQSHQVATVRAMQGALRTTLERFSPSAIRARAGSSGVLERIVPAARDAALWQAYEREFGGVAQGSDEAFLDMFAKEFREAYGKGTH